MGCGFLVSSKYIFTCAHVVLDALKLKHSTIEKPEQIIFLDFPLLERQPGVNAKVKKWYPIKPSAVIRRIGE